ENDEFNEHRFWFSFFYIFESAARYYEICKARKLPLGWFHVYQFKGQLSRMSDRDLADIGTNRLLIDDVAREAAGGSVER
ncbi:DUF1127 domain-containing protein, partial [Yoonia sp.]|uniref:DUF1127 domain-containing protein n=1 Tax=Yoonia sp. TaxID=2212373 RepID=UPI00397686F0